MHHQVALLVADEGIAFTGATTARLFQLKHKGDIAMLATRALQVNLDITDSVGPGKLVRRMQNLSYTYDEYLICIGLGPSISSVICKNLSYSGPSYPSSPIYILYN